MDLRIGEPARGEMKLEAAAAVLPTARYRRH
jgi:hypothetical protein